MSERMQVLIRRCAANVDSNAGCRMGLNNTPLITAIDAHLGRIVRALPELGALSLPREDPSGASYILRGPQPLQIIIIFIQGTQKQVRSR